MSATYQVDSGRVAVAAQQVQVTASAITSEADSMMRQLSDLSGSWRGSAAAMFADLIAQWRATQVQLESSLGQINQALSVAAQSYADAEHTATRLFAH